MEGSQGFFLVPGENVLLLKFWLQVAKRIRVALVGCHPSSCGKERMCEFLLGPREGPAYIHFKVDIKIVQRSKEIPTKETCVEFTPVGQGISHMWPTGKTWKTEPAALPAPRNLQLRDPQQKWFSKPWLFHELVAKRKPRTDYNSSLPPKRVPLSPKSLFLQRSVGKEKRKKWTKNYHLPPFWNPIQVWNYVIGFVRNIITQIKPFWV